MRFSRSVANYTKYICLVILLLGSGLCRAEPYDFLNDTTYREVPVIPIPIEQLGGIKIGSDIRKVFREYGIGREVKDAPLVGVIQPLENGKLVFFCFWKLESSVAANQKLLSSFEGEIQSIYVFDDFEKFFQGHFLKPDSLQGQSLSDVFSRLNAEPIPTEANN